MKILLSIVCVVALMIIASGVSKAVRPGNSLYQLIKRRSGIIEIKLFSPILSITFSYFQHVPERIGRTENVLETWHVDIEKSAVVGNVTHLRYQNVPMDAGHLFILMLASEQDVEGAENDHR